MFTKFGKIVSKFVNFYPNFDFVVLSFPSRDMNYLHFDPTREDHSKFVLPKVEEDDR